MCVWETHIMLCVHPIHSKKYRCHDKRCLDQCFGPHLFPYPAIYYQDFPCDSCKFTLSQQDAETKAKTIAGWREAQAQHLANAEAARQRDAEWQAEETLMVQEMIRKGGNGGGSGDGGGSSSGGNWSDREVKKPYQR